MVGRTTDMELFILQCRWEAIYRTINIFRNAISPVFFTLQKKKYCSLVNFEAERGFPFKFIYDWSGRKKSKRVTQ